MIGKNSWKMKLYIKNQDNPLERKWKKKARRSINQILNDEIEIIQFKKIPTKRSIHVNLRNQ